MARGTERYVRASLAIDPGNPPWHRGFVAVGNVVGAITPAWLLDWPSAAYLASAFALLYTLSDGEGTLPMRLHAISWPRSSWAAGRWRRWCWPGSRSQASRSSAWDVRRRRPVVGRAAVLRAPRFGMVVFAIALASEVQSVETLLTLLFRTTATAVTLVCIEHVLAPDRARTPCSTLRIAWGLVNADRRTVLRLRPAT